MKPLWLAVGAFLVSDMRLIVAIVAAVLPAVASTVMVHWGLSNQASLESPAILNSSQQQVLTELPVSANGSSAVR